MPGRAFLALCLASAVAGAQVRTEIIVASTTDVHGRLVGWDYFADRRDTLRGLSRAATVVDSLRAAHPGRVVLVDAGDLLQGNPLTYVAARIDTVDTHPVIAAMNAMRYDAAAIGNHEFNYGIPTLRKALARARFPFLAANAVPLGRERGRSPLLAPSRIVTRGGLRVAIVGATTPGSMVWDRENLAGRLRITDVVPAVRRTVRAVRQQGVDAVVVVMHSGLDSGESSYDTVSTGVPAENVADRVAREVPGIDLVVFGHSHREVADSTINGVLVQQPRNWAQSVGVATLAFERRAGRWRLTKKSGRLVPVAGRAEHPAVVAAVSRKHDVTTNWVTTSVGTTEVGWRADSSRVMDTPLIDFINEVQRKATGADLSATSAFDLNASLDAGPITVAEVARLYPYDNTLRAVRITGAQLRAFLEFSARYYRTPGTPDAAASLVDPSIPGFNFDMVTGADYTLDLSRPVGQRVTRLQVRGRDVTDTDTFTMAVNNYRQTGGGGFAMLHGAPVVYDRQEEVRDLLIAEVRRQGTLRPQDYHTVNWRLEPRGIAGDAYRAMRRLPFDRSTAPADTSRPSRDAHLATGRWLRVIGTNDFHGGIEARDFNAEGIVRGGAASLATALKEARAACRPPGCTSIWLDAGDQWQGTPSAALTRGRLVTEFMNRHGLAAAALGNHEFDWSVDTMRLRLRDNRFPVLAANMKYKDGRDVEWMPDDTLLVVDGLRIGVVGVISEETARTVRASYVAPFQFVPPAPVIDAHARALRARGADVVLVVGHLGASCEGRALDVCTGDLVEIPRQLTTRVEAIVGGHMHRGTAAVVNGTAAVQAYQKGSAIGVVDIPLEPRGEPRVALRNVRPDSVPPDPVEARWVDSVTRPVREKLGVTVATMGEAVRRGAGPLADLVVDGMHRVGGGDLAVLNSGGVRADLRPGPVTLGDVFEVQPFENRLVRVPVRGAELLRYLEGLFERPSSRFHVGGARIVVDTTRPAGSRVVSATLSDGRAIQRDGTYRVVMPDFLAEGGDTRGLILSSPPEVLPLYDREALERHLRQLPQPVRAPGGPPRVTFTGS